MSVQSKQAIGGSTVLQIESGSVTHCRRLHRIKRAPPIRSAKMVVYCVTAQQCVFNPKKALPVGSPRPGYSPRLRAPPGGSQSEQETRQTSPSSGESSQKKRGFLF